MEIPGWLPRDEEDAEAAVRGNCGSRSGRTPETRADDGQHPLAVAAAREGRPRETGHEGDERERRPERRCERSEVRAGPGPGHRGRLSRGASQRAAFQTLPSAARVPTATCPVMLATSVVLNAEPARSAALSPPS